MAMLSGMFAILCFALTAGIVVSLVIFVPLFIYVIPYCLWHGFQLQVGRYKEQKNAGFFTTVRYASRLYASWIFHRDPTF